MKVVLPVAYLTRAAAHALTLLYRSYAFHDATEEYPSWQDSWERERLKTSLSQSL